ncbi:N-acetylmuramoyl-L-alanine amidase [bacterium]|nr:N-acetylmuramoyl-L-alanine amidase [bacterium]MCI0604197.1 N-acetylmuramoyl-L-alanine amidase [bacterium]
MRKAFGRGFDSRRLHHVLFLFLFLLACDLLAQDQALTIFEDSRKLQVSLQTIEGAPFVNIADLQTPLGFQINPVVGNQNISLVSGSHSVILSANRSLVSVDQKLVSLSKPVYLVQGAWLVPLDFIPKVLRGVTEKRFLWLENSRSLMIGNVQANQVTLKYASESKYSRLVFQSLSPISYMVQAEGNVLFVIPQSEDFSPGFQNAVFEDGLVQNVTIETRENRKVFKIQTGIQYASYRTFELKDPPRFVIDFYGKGSTTEQPAPVVPPQTQTVPPTLLPSPIGSKKVIVIDPGHGGAETGAKGPNGTLEKDVTMSIARKLKSIVESTGMRAILTRDGDQVVTLDDRTSKANNNKADLFISIHANATIRGRARGAETYFLSAQATDDESRNIAAVENNAIGLNQAPAIEDDLKLILWDMAQTEFLAESSQLAETIQQELNNTLSISNRGIKQAPFRVLTGATMPAVLIEVGFINNPDEEKLMADAEYQMKIATAIFRSIQAFQNRNQEASSTISTSGQ